MFRALQPVYTEMCNAWAFVRYKSNFSFRFRFSLPHTHTQTNNSPLASTENVNRIQETEAKIEKHTDYFSDFFYSSIPNQFMVTYSIILSKKHSGEELSDSEVVSYIHPTLAAIRTSARSGSINSVEMRARFSLSLVGKIYIGKLNKMTIYTFKWSWNCVEVLQKWNCMEVHTLQELFLDPPEFSHVPWKHIRNNWKCEMLFRFRPSFAQIA